MLAALLASSVGAAAAPGPAAGYRCAGTGELVGTYRDFGDIGEDSGWGWFLRGEAACALSPDGPWLATIEGGANAPRGSLVLTEQPLVLPTQLRVNWTLENPRTGCVRRFTHVWNLVTARTKIVDPPSYALADAPTYALAVFRRNLNAGACNDKVGSGVGVGTLLRVVSPQDVAGTDPNPIFWGARPKPGDQVVDPFLFAVNYP